MNENTRKQLEVTSPNTARPVDKLRLTEWPAATGAEASPSGFPLICASFADDE